MRDPLDPIPFPFIPDEDEREIIQFLRDYCRPESARELSNFLREHPNATPDELAQFVDTLRVDDPDPPRAG